MFLQLGLFFQKVDLVLQGTDWYLLGINSLLQKIWWETNLFFSNEGVVEKERRVRCIIPPMVSPGQRWDVVQHKKFP